MARKMGEDGPKQQIREINGHLYAYTSTSKMVDGKKKTVNVLAGKWDPETETVIPKKPRKSKAEYARIRAEKNPSIDLSKVSSRCYGAACFLDSLQRRMFIGEDLMRAFGHSAKAIMSYAMALTINPGPFSAIEGTLECNYIREMYGIEMPVDSRSMSEFTNNIGKCGLCADTFFECRITRGNGLLAWDTTTNGTYGDMGGMAEWGTAKDDEDLKVVKRALATDLRGIPLMYRFYPGSLSDLATVERLEADIERYGRSDCIFVMDRGFESGYNLHMMLDKGRRFVIPAKLDSKAVKSVLTDFKRTKERSTMVYDGHAYTVWKTEIGLKSADRMSVNGSPTYDLTNIDDDGHAAEGLMTAYVCYDTKKYSDEVQNRELMIDSLQEYARNMDSPQPVKAFKKRAGKAAKYFEITADGRKVILTEKKNARSFSDNRAGMFVMICSPGISWELMMPAYDARRLVEQVFDTEKEQDRRLRTADPVTLEGRYFIQFIAQILQSEIKAVLREKDSDSRYTMDGLLATLNTLDVLQYGGQKGLSEVTKNVRNIFGLFDMDVPKEPLNGVEMTDLLNLMHPVPEGEHL